MKVSVVILNWNGCDMLRTFLPSVIRYSKSEEVEVCVADNGSTDASVEMLREEFPCVRIIVLDQNHGFADGYKGLNVHNGEGGIWKSEGYPRPGLIDSQDDLLSLNTSENVSVWPVLLQRSTLIDSDNDGMPDAWERKFGLNPHDASDGNGKTIDKYGQYTNLEMYMNSLVHDIIEKQNSGGKK